MKACLTALFVLLASFAYATVSLDDIVKLSKMKTSDEVILKLIQKEGISKPVTAKDVVFLKQQGVSDEVIQYLVKLSDTQALKMPPQEGKSVSINENMRAYYTTTKTGKKIRVVTNLDEKGKRMGGELPPDPEPQQQEQIVRYERPAPEIRVVVEDSRRRDEPDYPEYPEYIDEAYITPSYPLYSPYYPVPSYFPNHGKGHHHKRGHHQPLRPGEANWNYDYSKNIPNPNRHFRPSPPTTQQPSKSRGHKPLRQFKG